MNTNQNSTGLAHLYSKSQCRKMIREALGNPTAYFQNLPGATSIVQRVNGRETEFATVEGGTESERVNRLVDVAFASKGYRVERFKTRIELVVNTYRDATPVEPTTVTAKVSPGSQDEQPAAKPTTLGARFVAFMGSLFGSSNSPETI